MKRYFTPVLLALLSVVSANAQESSSKTTPKICWLQVQGGGGINNAYDMKGSLNTPSISASGQAASYTNIKGFYTVGIGGMKLVTEQLMIGGAFNYGNIFKQSNILAEFKTTTYNGMINIGELLYNKDGLMVYPYIGVGYSWYNMNVTNKSTTDNVVFDLNNPITPSNSKVYRTEYLMFELAIGAKKIINDYLAVGADAGIYLSSTYGGDWKDNGTTITSRTAPGSNGGFIRATISCGLFKK